MVKLRQEVLTERIGGLLKERHFNLMVICECSFDKTVEDIGEAAFEMSLKTGHRFHRIQAGGRWRYDYLKHQVELFKDLLCAQDEKYFDPFVVFMPVLNQMDVPFVIELQSIKEEVGDIFKIVLVIDGDWILKHPENLALLERFFKVDFEELGSCAGGDGGSKHNR